MRQYRDTKYHITENGEVYAIYKYRNAKFLKQYTTVWGYKYVTISTNDKKKNVVIHRMVAECFIPNPDNKPQVNHKNGIKTDNRVNNLEWVTRRENQDHCNEIQLRTPVRGSRSNFAKLKEAQVLEIRELHASGVKSKELSVKYNISQSVISEIVNRKIWVHI